MNSQRPSWRRLPIEATCSRITSGGTPLRSVLRFYDGGSIRWVKTGELKDWYIEDTEERITEDAIQESSAKLLPKETVLMAMYGDGKTITSLGILRHESACNQASCAMIANPAVCRPLYLFYSLKAHRHALLKLAYGGAQRNLNAKTIRQFELAVPPMPIQGRIASILSSYDDLIENNDRRIKTLEEMAQTLYREWFVNFHFPGHQKVKMVESELGPIPKGWMPKRLGDLCHETRRGVDPGEIDPATPYIGLEHLPRKSIALDEWGRAGDVGSTKLRFRRGEILFGKIRPYFHKVGVAPVDGVASSDAIVIVPNDPAYFGPVLCCVSSEDFVRHATQTSQGTKMPRANWDVLTKYPLPLPGGALLEQFNGIVHPTVEMLQNLVFRNRNLRTTRDFLLPKLISGEIPVEASAELVEQAV